MKTAFLAVLLMVATPFALGFIGAGLSWLFSCTGMDHITACSVPALTGLISALVSCLWLAAFAIPAGGVALLLLGVIQAIRMLLSRKSGT